MKNHIWLYSRNKKISAMLHTPSNCKSNGAIVIICHGFTGEKIGGSQFYLRIANALENNGYSVLRFDFVGSGESEGEFSEDTYVSGWIEDLNEIIKFIKEQHIYSKIFLLGHSLGGYIVLNHDVNLAKINGIILLATEFQPLENYGKNILGNQLWMDLIDNKEIQGFFGKDLSLKPKFANDLIEYHQLSLDKNIDMSFPITIIHGDKDDAVSIQYAKDYYNKIISEKYLKIIEGADHGFKDKSGELYEYIIEFLEMMD